MGISGWSFVVLLIATSTKGSYGLVQTYLCGSRRCYNNHNNNQYHSLRQQHAIADGDADADTTPHTDVSFTLPRFLQEEISEGTYPSPLHTIHVKSILSDEEVAKCRQLSYQYAAETKCWDQPDVKRHVTYSTCDFPIEDNEQLASYLADIQFDERIWTNLQELYGLALDNNKYHYLSYLDFFVAQYQANEEEVDDEKRQQQPRKTMDRLEAHRDGSLLSFTILLNDPTEFEGGGTFFDGLLDIVVADDKEDSSTSKRSKILQPGGVIQPQRAGDATFHSGKLLHGAKVITKGKRTVLVGFVDVADYLQRPGVISEACKDWGRMDVALFRYKRQISQVANNKEKGGWFGKNNARWIQQTNHKEGVGRSCIQGGFIPAFSSVGRRADPEYQRLKKLETEDRLLRSILLPQDEIVDPSQRFELSELLDGDITIL